MQICVCVHVLTVNALTSTFGRRGLRAAWRVLKGHGKGKTRVKGNPNRGGGHVAKNYLFLDTQVFHRFAFDFMNKHLVQLTHMAADGSLVLLMPEMTRREIESHIAEKAAEIFGALRDLRRLGKNLQKPPFNTIGKGGTVEAIQEELMGQFEDFCKLTNVEHLPVKGLNLGRVLDDYFGRKPPFGEGS
jgi:hypothetical protein